MMPKANIECPDIGRRLQVRALLGLVHLLTHCSCICVGLKDQHSSQFPLHLCRKEKLVLYGEMVNICTFCAQWSNSTTGVILNVAISSSSVDFLTNSTMSPCQDVPSFTSFLSNLFLFELIIEFAEQIDFFFS